ncbi:sigma-70 family RNA polymerase sigma factor [Pedobacter sp. MC2016-24]|uniref:RNA polymerase sigma factor n=1 Tax=Pedobacter sp. MC2016-24 TaxID=2780090 RepID=UPI00187F25AE|nr:sigma-70 family RNA polymerase sigma factor [Pedobacter sp. MC2016-24]
MRSHSGFDVVAFNQKEVAAYNYVFRFYYPSLCQFTGRLIGRDFAEDLVEELFLRLWSSEKTFNNEEHLKAFLYHSIKNASLDFLKTTKRAVDRNTLFTEEHSFNEADYLAGIIRSEVLIELYQAIAELPTEKGRIIKMTYLDGKSNQETAAELGISIQTVKNQKLRGLALLKNKLPDGIYAFIFLYPFVK